MRSSLPVAAFIALVSVGCIPIPDPNGPMAHAAPRPIGKNPLAGARFYVDPGSNAKKQADSWRGSRPADAAALDLLASQPHGSWFGEWSGDVANSVDQYMTHSDGATPLLVVYNITHRDCGQYSAGGAGAAGAYRVWIREVAQGIGSRPAIVILEPDGLALLTKCLTPDQQAERLALISDAVGVLAAEPKTSLYLDAGNAKWIPAAEMAARLERAGIAGASGFALNVSNYFTTEESIAYGTEVSSHLGGKHFVIDTSRNGNGATADKQWCNPDGRAIGPRPTTTTASPVVDAYLWIKPPGESDGTCNGGPRAGDFWPEQALGLAQRAK